MIGSERDESTFGPDTGVHFQFVTRPGAFMKSMFWGKQPAIHFLAAQETLPQKPAQNSMRRGGLQTSHVFVYLARQGCSSGNRCLGDCLTYISSVEYYLIFGK